MLPAPADAAPGEQPTRVAWGSALAAVSDANADKAMLAAALGGAFGSVDGQEEGLSPRSLRGFKHAVKLALYTQTEFQKRLPAHKVPLAEFAFNHSSKSITPAEASPTLQACELKDGDGLHVHSNHWGPSRVQPLSGRPASGKPGLGSSRSKPGTRLAR